MTVAIFEKIEAPLVGVIRVYDDLNAPTPQNPRPKYKFCTIGAVREGEVEIIGMTHSGIVYGDSTAIVKELRSNKDVLAFDPKEVYWTHDEVRHRINAMRRRFNGG